MSCFANKIIAVAVSMLLKGFIYICAKWQIMVPAVHIRFVKYISSSYKATFWAEMDVDVLS